MDRQTRKKRKIEKRLSMFFRVALVLPTLAWGIICLIGTAFPEVMDTVDYDLGENRVMAGFPDSFSSNWFGEVEACYNDHLPFRSVLMSANKGFQSFIEIPYENGIKGGLIALLHSDSKETSPAETETTMDIGNLFGDDETTETVIDTTEENTETTEKTTEKTTADKTKETSTKDDDSTEESDTEDTSEADTDMTEEDTSEADTTETETEKQTEPDRSTAATVESTEAGDKPTAPVENIDTSEYMPPVVKNESVIIGRGDWLFLYTENNINYYLGNNIYNDNELAAFSNTLVQLKYQCDRVGKKLSLMIVPNKEQIYSEYMPNYEVENNNKRLQRFADYMKATYPNVPFVYPINELKATKPYYRVYCKYDTHWSAIGAFMGTMMTYKQLGMKTANLFAQQITTDPYAFGDLIGLGGLDAKDYKNDLFYNIAYRPEITLLSEAGDYGTEESIYYSTSNSPNSQKAVLIGDSYRGLMVRLYSKDFAELTAFHLHRINEAPAIEAIKNADVISLVCVERNDLSFYATAQNIVDILSKL